MTAIQRKKTDTDLGILILRNMAMVMERERVKRNLTKTALAQLSDMTAPYYLKILDGTANPSLQVITRISTNLKIPLAELLMGPASVERWRSVSSSGEPGTPLQS